MSEPRKLKLPDIWQKDCPQCDTSGQYIPQKKAGDMWQLFCIECDYRWEIPVVYCDTAPAARPPEIPTNE